MAEWEYQGENGNFSITLLRLQKKRCWKNNAPGNELQSKEEIWGTASGKITGSGDLLLLRIERKNFWFLIAWIKERIKNPR